MNGSIEDAYRAALQRAADLGIKVVATGQTKESLPCFVTTASDGVGHHLVVQTATELRCDCEHGQHKPHELCTHRAVAHREALQARPSEPQPATAASDEVPPRVYTFDGRRGKKCLYCGRGFTVGESIWWQGGKTWHDACDPQRQQRRGESAPLARSHQAMSIYK